MSQLTNTHGKQPPLKYFVCGGGDSGIWISDLEYGNNSKLNLLLFKSVSVIIERSNQDILAGKEF